MATYLGRFSTLIPVAALSRSWADGSFRPVHFGSDLEAMRAALQGQEQGPWAGAGAWTFSMPPSLRLFSASLSVLATLRYKIVNCRAARRYQQTLFLDLDFGTTSFGNLFLSLRCCSLCLDPRHSKARRLAEPTNIRLKMLLPSAQLSRPLAVAGLLLLAFLCLVYSRAHSSPALATQPGDVAFIIKRTRASEQGLFSTGPPDESAEDEEIVTQTVTSAGHGTERLTVPGLGDPLPPLGASVVGGSAAAAPLPGLPTPPTASADLFSSVISILAGAPTVPPASPGETSGALQGLLSVLSQVGPLSAATTALAVIPTGSAGLVPAVDALGGVAEALDHVLGSSSDGDGLVGGLLGQLSADLVAPFASIAADTASIRASPSAALGDLQGHISSFMGDLPSVVAVGVQLANNVGGQIADTLNATTEVLDSVPDVAAGMADQVGFLLNAAPNLATGLPAVVLSAVNQMGSVLDTDLDLVGDPTGTLSGLRKELSSAMVEARPGVTSLAAAVGAHVVDALPPVLRGPVQGVLSSLQDDVGGSLCQASDIVGGTAIIFNVPCGSVDPLTSDLGALTTATAPAAASASITVGATSPFSLTSATSSRPPLTSILSSLVSSLTSVGITDANGGDPDVVPALSGLSSLFSQISALSLTATTTPLTLLPLPTGKMLTQSLPARRLICCSAAFTKYVV